MEFGLWFASRLNKVDGFLLMWVVVELDLRLFFWGVEYDHCSDIGLLRGEAMDCFTAELGPLLCFFSACYSCWKKVHSEILNCWIGWRVSEI